MKAYAATATRMFTVNAEATVRVLLHDRLVRNTKRSRIRRHSPVRTYILRSSPETYSEASYPKLTVTPSGKADWSTAIRPFTALMTESILASAATYTDTDMVFRPFIL